MDWKAYNELAWTVNILACPESCEKEAMTYVNAIKRFIPLPSPTMLHLGCGAGAHDFHFKKYFQVTGVDLSQGMLDLAKKANEDVTYVLGDMRTIHLNQKFDAVVIPDSIAYMITLVDLKQALLNAARHLKTDGVLFVVSHIKEDFRENNFAYSGVKDDIYITLFENNHIVSDSTYEAIMVYLIRQYGKTNIYHETHTLGLFSYEQWLSIFKECQLKVDEINIDHLYDDYLLEEGRYRLKMFIGTSNF
jgi:ubiquinone/menaquinone biosynthesis C-methylase UbiE